MDRFEAPCHQSQQRIPTLPQLCTAQHKPRQGLQDPQGYVVMTLLKADSPVDLRLQRLISLTAHTRQVHRVLVTPGNYFSTVLSPAASERSASSPTPSSSAHAEADQAQHNRQEAQSHVMPARRKKKGNIHS